MKKIKSNLTKCMIFVVAKHSTYTDSVASILKIPIVILSLISFLSTNLLCQTAYITGEPKLAYWEIGDKEQTVVILHGGPCAQHQYLRPEFDGLNEIARIIYYDQRGCGKSPAAKSYHWKKHVEDLNRLIKFLSPNKKVFLAGSSWGSHLALLYCYTYPEKIKGIILSGLTPWGGKGMNQKEYQKYKYEQLINVVEPDTFRFEIVEHRINKMANDDGTYRTNKTKIKKPVIQNIGMSSGETRISQITAPVFDSLSQINTPCLIFNGPPPCRHHKTVMNYVNILKNTCVVPIEGSCHDPWLANPEVFIKKSMIFIDHLKKTKIFSVPEIQEKLN